MNKVCAHAGCRTITTNRHCPACSRQALIVAKRQATKRAKRSKSNRDKGTVSFYGSVMWKSLRARKIKKDPLCQLCMENGFIKEGRDIDHIIEVFDDFTKRFEMSNLQTLCRSCHMHKTNNERKLRNNK